MIMAAGFQAGLHLWRSGNEYIENSCTALQLSRLILLFPGIFWDALFFVRHWLHLEGSEPGVILKCHAR